MSKMFGKVTINGNTNNATNWTQVSSSATDNGTATFQLYAYLGVQLVVNADTAAAANTAAAAGTYLYIPASVLHTVVLNPTTTWVRQEANAATNSCHFYRWE